MPKSLLINLANAPYSLSYEDGAKKVKDRWPTPSNAQAALPWAWARCKAMGMTSEQFQNWYLFSACFMDACWTQEAPNNLTSGYLNSYVFVQVPFGRFMSNLTLQVPRAGMQGGSSFFYAGTGGDQGQVATEIVMDDTGWLKSADIERRLFETPNASLTTNSAYNEGCSITQMHLTGPAKYGDGKTRIGLFMKRMGECSYVNQVRSDSFQWGFVANDGVPLTIGTITAFWNEFGGMGCLGTALATINIGTLSGDSNGNKDGKSGLLVLKPGYDAAGGGRINVGLLKSEDFISAGTRSADQVAVYAEGQYALNIGTINFSNGSPGNKQPMLVMNPTLGGGQNQSSLLTVGAAIGFGYSTALKNLVTGQSWTSPGDYAAFQLSHYAKGDKLVSGCVDLVPSSGPTTPTDPTTPPTGGNIDRTGWKASGTVQTTAKPASLAIDGSTSTFCETGRPHVVGDYIEIDMQTTRSIGGVTILYQPYGNAWPNKVELFTSLTGAANSWTSRGVFQGSATCTMTLPAKVNCRYFKAVTKELIPNVGGPWCAISDVSAKG